MSKLTSASSANGLTRKKSHDPLGDRLKASALAFTDAIVAEAGEVLVKGMRGELPGSDAREQRLCAAAIRGERVPSASSLPSSAPRVVVQIAPYAQIEPRAINTRSTPAALPQWNREVGEQG